MTKGEEVFYNCDKKTVKVKKMKILPQVTITSPLHKLIKYMRKKSMVGRKGQNL